MQPVQSYKKKHIIQLIITKLKQTELFKLAYWIWCLRWPTIDLYLKQNYCCKNKIQYLYLHFQIFLNFIDDEIYLFAQYLILKCVHNMTYFKTELDDKNQSIFTFT